VGRSFDPPLLSDKIPFHLFAFDCLPSRPNVKSLQFWSIIPERSSCTLPQFSRSSSEARFSFFLLSCSSCYGSSSLVFGLPHLAYLLLTFLFSPCLPLEKFKNSPVSKGLYVVSGPSPLTCQPIWKNSDIFAQSTSPFPLSFSSGARMLVLFPRLGVSPEFDRRNPSGPALVVPTWRILSGLHIPLPSNSGKCFFLSSEEQIRSPYLRVHLRLFGPLLHLVVPPSV